MADKSTKKAAAKKAPARKTTARKTAPAKKATAPSSSPKAFDKRAAGLAAQSAKFVEDTRGSLDKLRGTYADVMDVAPAPGQEALQGAVRRVEQTFADVERALGMLTATATDVDRATV